MTPISKTTTRPMLSMPFGQKAPRSASTPPMATLSSHELKRIVAAMLG